MDAGVRTDNPWRTMANKRMISKEIIDSDAFLSMPISAQNLYFHLLMRADDDGFIDCVKKIMRFVGAGDDDLKILLAKRYLLAFDSGIIVIKHWRLHNTIQRDRYHATKYQEEMTRLFVKENGAYTDHKIDEIKSLPEIEIPPTREPVNEMLTECIQPVNEMETEIRLDYIRLDKVREEPACFQDNKILRIEKAKSAWNAVASKIKAPICRHTALSMPRDDLREIIKTLDHYTDDEILKALENYVCVFTDKQYTPFPVYHGFYGFVKSGVEKYLDESCKELCRNKDSPSTEPVSRKVDKRCPVCGEEYGGTVGMCTGCGWEVGQDPDDPKLRPWWEENMKRKKSAFKGL